jgi:general secretion pathway protein A
MESYLAKVNLQERPFEIVTDPRFYFASREHREAMARLSYLVDQESMYFGMLTGEIGCGKSITRKVFTGQVDWQKHFVVEFENSGFAFEELLQQLLLKAGQPRQEVEGLRNLARMFEMVAVLITELQRLQDRQLVLLFDEAQDLSSESLLALKRLSNLNGEVAGSLTTILIGQPELRDKVAALPALDQRISLRFHLPNLGVDEVADFLRHRLRVAGHPTGELFSPEASDLIARASRGTPREINRLAKLSLEAATALGFGEVHLEQVESVLADLRRHQSFPAILPARI